MIVLKGIFIFVVLNIFFNFSSILFAHENSINQEKVVLENTNEKSIYTNLDIDDLLKETQKMSREEDEIIMIWWLPIEFWKMSFAKDSTMPEKQSKELISHLNNYTILAVVNGKIGTLGNVEYQSEKYNKKILSLKDKNNNTYHPLEDKFIDNTTAMLLSMMKPVLGNMLGPLGENMFFYIFPSIGKDKKVIVDPWKEGIFLVDLGEREFLWKLPLNSLIPPQNCPKCKEKLKGSYKYCPYDGTKLNY
ncbi:MAG: hypothetical protein H7A23_26260 [Leptospiraceae bacterium]|nr:hypothetical protein [Leptospiraceae bacterium]MCP5498075.1 hypothetical protein [Leptospiraceae bacterium]